MTFADRGITLLTDYGEGSLHAGLCRALVAELAPNRDFVDLTHSVPPFDVRSGAIMLERFVRVIQPAIHVGIVDPGVGSSRRSVAISVEDRIFVGPDNGLLIFAVDACGPISDAVELDQPRYWRGERTGVTFDGRDVFLPVAAHLSSGVAMVDLGSSIEPASLVRLEPVISEVGPDGTMKAEVVAIDRYGNVQLAMATSTTVEAGIVLGDTFRIDEGLDLRFVRSFAEVELGTVIVYGDSDGHLSIAANRGSAAQMLGITTGDVVVLARA